MFTNSGHSPAEFQVTGGPIGTPAPVRDFAGKRFSLKSEWDLCTSPVDYPHPSAKFYMEGSHASYPVTNFMEMDVVLIVKLDRQ